MGTSYYSVRTLLKFADQLRRFPGKAKQLQRRRDPTMPRNGILYEQVTEAIAALHQNRKKVTVRAIQALTGGSMSTVLKHYQRWQGEQLGQDADHPGISDQLLEALQRELRNHARRTLLNTNARLEQNDENCRRAEAARAAAMARILELEGQLQKAHGQIRLLQKELRQQGLLLEQTRDNAVRLEGELQQQRQQNRSRPPRNATVAKPALPGTCDDAQQETFEF